MASREAELHANVTKDEVKGKAALYSKPDMKYELRLVITLPRHTAIGRYQTVAFYKMLGMQFHYSNLQGQPHQYVLQHDSRVDLNEVSGYILHSPEKVLPSRAPLLTC